ncbi:MAG: hypothetical protein EOQ92_10610 [Mesorhizobium sp.]|nr:MAG: hypothetical protein EOQ92_10610 [Mesorhizobium sp.]RWK51781.1 MAG: hypothetical protein EOR47_06210 [Mesorhizobium sp.]RWK93971.1 MAG: hypothetical protein EOR45_26395 [Mesorhizobium sp.]RWK97060.1 MAG: hypothetical protein EOR53_06410 [Mesorhizobium sp.]TIP55005.1 MAG: hypothetical protein E5X56_30555 [Mesorhizobium sp.]
MPRSRSAGFSPFTGRRCRQADEGRRYAGVCPQISGVSATCLPWPARSPRRSSFWHRRRRASPRS